MVGKEATVLFRAIVASEMVVIAATIAAPSARALETRNARGRSEMCILRFGKANLGYEVALS